MFKGGIISLFGIILEVIESLSPSWAGVRCSSEINN